MSFVKSAAFFVAPRALPLNQSSNDGTERDIVQMGQFIFA